jgi:hypothetical protein
LVPADEGLGDKLPNGLGGVAGMVVVIEGDCEEPVPQSETIGVRAAE